MLKIHTDNALIDSCTSVILVPEKALEEAGYIMTMTDKNEASSKHEFHAMAQMAYFQFQDDELDLKTISGIVRIDSGDRHESLEKGLILYRHADGGFHALVHEHLNSKKLLEAAYRFCTRWVRLDI